jgi:hypothetical protein
MRLFKDWAKRRLRGTFEVGQRFGINITPRHFYSSIPDIAVLKRDDHWRKAFEMVGVAGLDVHEQVAFLENLCPPSLIQEWPSLKVHRTADEENGQSGGYGVIEAEILHAFIRHHRPQRVIQIGCGLSTAVILRAASLAGYHPQIACIDPYPSRFLQDAHSNGRITLLQERAELVSRETMTNLQSGDLLFVDSTHTVRPGSEVNRIILDVLPRLDSGIFVHFHDIYFPYDYQRDLMSEGLFFNSESTLLHAFLINNPRCRIALSTSMVHYAAPEQLKALFTNYIPQTNSDGLRGPAGGHFPSATYLLTRDANGDAPRAI